MDCVSDLSDEILNNLIAKGITGITECICCSKEISTNNQGRLLRHQGKMFYAYHSIANPNLVKESGLISHHVLQNYAEGETLSKAHLICSAM